MARSFDLGDARADVLAAVRDLEDLLRAHAAPTDVRVGVVDATSPGFAVDS